MRGDDQRRAVARGLLGKEVDHLRRRRIVEVRGRLVGEQQLGAVHHRARDGDALLLALRQLARPPRAFVSDAEGAERVGDARVVLRHLREVLRKAQVVAHAEMLHEVQRLQHDADRRAAPAIEPRGVQTCEVLSRDFHLAFARPNQAGNDVKQRRLAAARGTEHEPALALRHRPLGKPQRLHDAIAMRQAADRDHLRTREHSI